MKRETNSDDLCANIAPAFRMFLDYTRRLKFSEKPNYKYLKDLFTGLKKDLNIEDEPAYDWIAHK